MEPNLKQYRINTIKEAAEYKAAGGSEFNRYYAALKTLLDRLQYNQVFDIRANIPESMYKQFIKAACIYMIEQAFDEIEFSEDYLFIRRKRNFS